MTLLHGSDLESKINLINKRCCFSIFKKVTTSLQIHPFYCGYSDGAILTNTLHRIKVRVSWVCFAALGTIMRQFIDSEQGYVILGLKDRAFCCSLDSEAVVELLPPIITPSRKTDDDGDEDEVISQNIVHQFEVQAVAIYKEKNDVWCAIARYNKTLALYRIKCLDGIPKSIPSITVHKTNKRVSCLAFAQVDKTLSVIIGADLAGDAVAYPLLINDPSTETEELLESNINRRLLLGHTASMLTAMCVTNNCIFTSDRDEKIRISQFPNTHLINGFFLGHTAFVSDISVDNTHCVSCGGDKTLRLWNIENMKELATFRMEDANIPIKVTLINNVVVVAFDESDLIQIYRIEAVDDERVFTLLSEYNIGSHVLGIKLLDESKLLVVAKEPHYVQSFSLAQDLVAQPRDTPCLKSLQSLAQEYSIEMPYSVLERDDYGHIKMLKREESRGPAHLMPWNDPARIERARARSRRNKKRRKEEN